MRGVGSRGADSTEIYTRLSGSTHRFGEMNKEQMPRWTGCRFWKSDAYFQTPRRLADLKRGGNASRIVSCLARKTFRYNLPECHSVGIYHGLILIYCFTNCNFPTKKVLFGVDQWASAAAGCWHAIGRESIGRRLLRSLAHLY